MIISSQHIAFNRSYWLKLEEHVRKLGKKTWIFLCLYGGLYLPKVEADGKRYVRYQVIGEHDVTVPTHYFKIFIDESNALVEAFILPNESITEDTPIHKFRTTVKKAGKVAVTIFKLRSTRNRLLVMTLTLLTMVYILGMMMQK